MAHQQIRVHGVRLLPHAAVLNPKFAQRSVISPDPFAYVRLEMESDGKRDALVYWRQAEEFFRASAVLSSGASPVTSCYCMLNAVKALLTARNVEHSDTHGVSGSPAKSEVCLSGEVIKVKKCGVLPSLIKAYKASPPEEKIALKDLLSEIPFVHRAYTLIYHEEEEFFIPIEDPLFVKKKDGTEAWFCAKISKSYAQTPLPGGFERGEGIEKYYVIRTREGFEWKEADIPASLERLTPYHRAIRNEVCPIVSIGRNRWYLRKQAGRGSAHSLPLLGRLLATMHRLSELSRYDPVRLDSHLKSAHGWLLTEFLALAPAQFVHVVASELTGKEFVHADSVRLPNS